RLGRGVPRRFLRFFLLRRDFGRGAMGPSGTSLTWALHPGSVRKLPPTVCQGSLSRDALCPLHRLVVVRVLTCRTLMLRNGVPNLSMIRPRSSRIAQAGISRALSSPSRLTVSDGTGVPACHTIGLLTGRIRGRCKGGATVASGVAGISNDGQEEEKDK